MKNYLDKMISDGIFEIDKSLNSQNLLRLSYVYAEKNSTDLSTWTGSIIVNQLGEVNSKGTNIFPENCIKTNNRYNKKYCTQDHAERNAIYKSSKLGRSTMNCKIITAWSPCYSCAVAIIHSGISEILIHYDMCEKTLEKWNNELIDSLNMLNESNIKIIIYKGEIGKCKSKFRNKIWYP